MKNIKEYISGKSGNAFFVTCIGAKYKKDFEKISLPFFKRYCKKYDIGLIVADEIIDPNYKKYKNLKNPAFQRLLIPNEISKHYKKYKNLCDIDTDCLPGFLSRNLFEQKKLKNNEIYLIQPYPKIFSKKSLGKRVSLLRKTYIDKKYPLDSLFIASDKEEGELLGYKFKGPWATIGTCLGTTKTLKESGNKIYKKLKKTKNFQYLQSYRVDYYDKIYKINWLPYEFQAIWNYEVALNYPFLFHKNYKKLLNDCVISTLYRVDMLHFAGTWPENSIFYNTLYKQRNILKGYYNKLDNYLLTKTKAKLYGKVKYNRKFP